MTSKHYGWQKNWQVDLSTSTATHDSGLVFQFQQSAPGVWDGEATNMEEWQSRQRMPIADLMKHAGRLAREAGDAFNGALAKRH